MPGDGQESIRCVIGPLANSVRDLVLFQRSVLDQAPWEEETALVPLPWKEVAPYEAGDVTVGVIWDDGYVLMPFDLHISFRLSPVAMKKTTRTLLVEIRMLTSR